MNLDNLGFDPYTCSLDELREKINYYNNLSATENDFQMAVKLFINSVYGCLGSRYYNLYNPNIAEAITLQGQDLIKYSSQQIDDYVSNYWHLDFDAHQMIAKYMMNIFSDFDAEKFINLAKNKCKVLITNQIGGDTDSSYISFNCIISECQIPDHMGSHFIHALYIYSLQPFIKKSLDKYAVTFNCDKNVEEFELEKVARTVIYLAKKHYVMDIAWKDGAGDGKFIDPNKEIIYAGIEVVQGSTPPWCRQKQKEFISWLIDFYNKGTKPNYSDIVAKVKEFRKLFELQDPDSIFKSLNINDYEKYIFDDKNNIVIQENARVPQHVLAAANYNNMLYTSAKKYATKYKFAKKGDKIKLYYINSDECFGYLPYAFPIEFAPKIDYDTNFEKTMLAPLNRLIEAAGYQPIPKNLAYASPLW